MTGDQYWSLMGTNSQMTCCYLDYWYVVVPLSWHTYDSYARTQKQKKQNSLI